MKKIFKKTMLSLGMVGAVAAPVASVIACSDEIKKPFNFSAFRDRVATNAENIGNIYVSYEDANGFKADHQMIEDYIYADSGTMAHSTAREKLVQYLNAHTEDVKIGAEKIWTISGSDLGWGFTRLTLDKASDRNISLDKNDYFKHLEFFTN